MKAVPQIAKQVVVSFRRVQKECREFVFFESSRGVEQSLSTLTTAQGGESIAVASAATNTRPRCIAAAISSSEDSED
jgi:16S rRNA C1402 (ribose-2'-O) methylase RsmI